MTSIGETELEKKTWALLQIEKKIVKIGEMLEFDGVLNCHVDSSLLMIDLLPSFREITLLSSLPRLHFDSISRNPTILISWVFELFFNS